MRLIIQQSDGTTHQVALDSEKTLRIGTHATVDVVVAGTGLHPVEVGIVAQGGRFRAVPSKAVGRLQYNGRPVTSAWLKPGDRIESGDLVIRVAAEAVPAIPELEPLVPLDELDSLDEPLDLEAPQFAAALEELEELEEPSQAASGTAADLLGAVEPLAAPHAAPGPARRSVATRGPSLASRLGLAQWLPAVLVLLFLIPLMVLLIAFLHSLPTAGDRFRIAERSYQQQAYADAMSQFARFLQWHPHDPLADEARVKRAAAEIRLVTADEHQLTRAWPDVQRLVLSLGGLAFHPVMQVTLAETLPGVGAAQMAEARSAQQRGAGAQAREAWQGASQVVAMLDRYVAPVLRSGRTVEGLRVAVLDTDRQMNQTAALTDTVDRIAKAQGFDEVYALRCQYVDRYPAPDPRLSNALRRAASRAAKDVRYEQLPPAAGKEMLEPAATLAAVVALAGGSERGAPNARPVPVVSPELGCLYSLDLATGRLLGRRDVGFDTQFIPTPLSAGHAAAWLMVDSRAPAVMRVDPVSLAPQWTRAVEPFSADPVIVGNEIWIAQSNGRMLEVDATSGKLLGAFDLGLPVSQTPVWDDASHSLFVLCDHSLLFAIDLSRHVVREALYLDHDVGSAVAPLVAFPDYVLVPLFDGVQSMIVHVVRLADSLQDVQTVSFPGCMDGAPAVFPDRVVFATRLGDVVPLLRNPGNAQQPFRAGDPLEHGDGHRRIVAALGDTLVTAGRGMVAYGRDGPVPVMQRQELTAAPRPVGSALLTTCRDFTTGEMVVELRGSVSAAPTWSTHLETPIVAPPLVTDLPQSQSQSQSQSKIYSGLALDATGSLHALDLGKPVVDFVAHSKPLVSAQLPGGPWLPLVGRTGRATLEACDPPTRVLAAPPVGGSELIIYDLDPPAAHVQRLPMELGLLPLAVGKRFLFGFHRGPLVLWDPARMQPAGPPWMPPDTDLEHLPQWGGAVRLNDGQIVVNDNRARRWYCLSVSQTPEGAHLVVEKAFDGPLAAALIANASGIWSAEPGAQEVAVVDPHQGTVVRQIRFSGPVIWGPEAVGDQLVAATADGHIHCLSAEGREQWQLEWDYGPLLAVLPTDDHTWYVLSCRGRVAAVDAATGARLGEPLALGHDLIGAPVFVATRRKWLLTGSGGTLWWFQPPPRAGAARPSDSNAE